MIEREHDWERSGGYGDDAADDGGDQWERWLKREPTRGGVEHREKAERDGK